MGITGELVRSVFSKSRSTKTHETNVIRSNCVEKKRWKSSVKSYLCGDELFDSVLAEEDSASVKTSEATVTTQSLPEDGHSTTEDIQSQHSTTHGNLGRDCYSSFSSKSLDEDAAAIIIQSAFRGFKARCLRREATGFQNEHGEGIQSPTRDSMATSVEVQTGNSIGAISIQEEDPTVPTKLQQKHKPPAFKPKEDWDCSTLDSTRSKLRIQNKLEAMTRRERALAYAFSQQLRICSKKQNAKSDGTEPNMGWNWLERWMATRQIEVSPAEDCTSNQLVSNEVTSIMKTHPSLKKRFQNLSFEEKESCGSNEVPVPDKSPAAQTKEDKDGCKLARNRLKSPRSSSRRNNVPVYQQKKHLKVSKRDGSKEPEKDRQLETKQTGSSSVCKDDASSRLSPDHCVSGQISKSEP